MLRVRVEAMLLRLLCSVPYQI